MRVHAKSYAGRGNARCGHTEIYEQNQQKKWKPMGSFIIMTSEQFTGEMQYGIQKNIEIYANLATY